MEEELKKKLSKDPDGLLTYEYIANNIEAIGPLLPELVDNMVCCDPNGQFCVSAARYLNAISPEAYSEAIGRLISAAIDKDRERAYIGQLLPDIWGADYAEHIDELKASDDNFRRIHKRIFPSGM